MKNSERFNTAITALVKGYLNDTLMKGQCCACAVGNMIAHCKNYEIIKEKRDDGSNHIDVLWTKNDIRPAWGRVFVTVEKDQMFDEESYHDEAKDEIDSTGYSLRELARIEFNFEKSTKISIDDYYKHTVEEIDEDQLKGLYAVVDVLCEIEGINDVNQIEEFKEMFVKLN